MATMTVCAMGMMRLQHFVKVSQLHYGPCLMEMFVMFFFT